MSIKQLDDALIGEMYEVLNSLESFVAQHRSDPTSGSNIDAIMQLRAKLITERPSAKAYTAAQLTAVFENALDAIVVIDDEGVITFFNLSAERMFGYSASEMVGQKVNALMPSPHREQHDEYIARYIQTEEAKVIGIGRDVMGRHKDGSSFPIHLTLSPARVGDIDMFAGFMHKIHQPKLDSEKPTQAQPQEMVTG